MITTLTELAKTTGVSYTTLQIFADRYNLYVGASVRCVDYNKDFLEKFKEFVKNKKYATKPMLMLGGLL